MDKELLKGSIDILLLSLLEKRDMYGYEMAKKLKETSNNLYTIGEGTLYPALQRLENKKAVRSYWGDSETGARRRYYSITDSGRKKLAAKMDEWNALNKLVNLCKGVDACPDSTII